jgi:hypothetical protein
MTRIRALGVLFLLAMTAWADDPVKPAAPTEEARAEVRRIVDDLKAEASRIRGLAWKHDVPADLVSRDRMIELFLEDLGEEYTPDEVARDNKIMRRTGLLGPEESLLDLTLVMLKEFVAGFYDPKTKRLYMIEGMAGDAQRPILLHELTHALDDQHFDLDARTRPYENDPDRLFAEKCIEEGCAEHARLLYEAAHPEIAQLSNKAQMNPEMARAQMEVFKKVPMYLILPTMLQYTVGPAFVRRVVGDDFAGGMARLMRDGPTTEEQCLHPERWLGSKRDLPRRVVWGGDLVAAAGEGWKLLHELPNGELDFALYVDFHLGGNRGRAKDGAPGLHRRALPAGAGWDAARDLFLEKEGKPIVWICAMSFDTEEDTAEAASAFLDAFRASAPDYVGDGTTWTTANGRGRMLQRGEDLLFLDGAPADRFEAIWSVLEKTRFEKDPNDGY